jgi:hypothetical protein
MGTRVEQDGAQVRFLLLLLLDNLELRDLVLLPKRQCLDELGAHCRRILYRLDPCTSLEQEGHIHEDQQEE